jgi:hypothetical protein
MIKFIDKNLLAGDFIESGDEKTISLVTDDVDEAYDCVFQHSKATKNH